MAATQLAVFYATESKILRRKVIPDDDEQLRQLHVPAGESVLWIPLDRPFDDASCRAAIAGATGMVPPSGRCCVVDAAGRVVAICNADPVLDVDPRGQLVPSDDAGLGDRYVGGRLLRAGSVAANSTITVVVTGSGAVSR
jgi:hypothetical protein